MCCGFIDMQISFDTTEIKRLNLIDKKTGYELRDPPTATVTLTTSGAVV